MTTKIIYRIKVALVVGLTLIACSDMNELHSPYLEDGEQIYVGKVLNPQYFPGNNRIKFTWEINADPKITKAIIKWRDSEDRTVEFPVSPGPGTVEQTIENIPEGGYNFDIFMAGDEGERSVKVQLTGVVYGEKYQKGISNPFAKAVYYNLANNPTKSLDLEWFGVSDQVVVIEIKYTKNDDTEEVVQQTRGLTSQGKPAPFVERTILPDYKPNTTISYRAGFLPSTAAIDTFYTEFKELSDERITRMIRPGIYRINAKHSGKAITVRANSANGNAQIEQNVYNDLFPSFKWTVKYNLDGYAVFTNKNSILDMAVASGGTPSAPLLTDGANIVQVAQLIPTEIRCNCHEEWTIAATDATSQLFKITNRNSNKVIEVQSGSTANGASVQQRTYSATANHQKFEFVLLQ